MFMGAGNAYDIRTSDSSTTNNPNGALTLLMLDKNTGLPLGNVDVDIFASPYTVGG